MSKTDKANKAKGLIPGDYASLLAEVKERVRFAQYTALKAVNRELVTLYWVSGVSSSADRPMQRMGLQLPSNWHRAFALNSRGLKGFPDGTYFICASSILPTTISQKCNNWWRHIRWSNAFRRSSRGSCRDLRKLQNFWKMGNEAEINGEARCFTIIMEEIEAELMRKGNKA